MRVWTAIFGALGILGSAIGLLIVAAMFDYPWPFVLFRSWFLPVSVVASLVFALVLWIKRSLDGELPMGAAASFLFGFLAVGITGVETIMSFEPLPSERIGASAALYLLGLPTSLFSTAFYGLRSETLRRDPKWFTGLLGGVIAGVAFCAPVAAAYALGFGSWVGLFLTFTLPILTGWLWPLVSARGEL
jgi:hypothetical protein